MTALAHEQKRLPAIDVLRGLVILVLIPDLTGAFSMHRMAERLPDSAAWAHLADQATHASWLWPTAWDFVMPAFVFLVGAGLQLSHAARRQRGDSGAAITAHALSRALALVLLGLMLGFPVKSWSAQLWPYLLILPSFAVSEWAIRRDWTPGRTEAATSTTSRVYWATLLAATLWVGWRLTQSEYDLNNILVQLGLAYLPAFALIQLSVARQLAAAGLILVLYATAFLAYTPLPSAVAAGPALAGLAPQWTNGTNVAAALDLWLLNLLPRSAPYTGNALGAHTLQFIALVPTMLGGALAAR
jgi:predicted acyltransferase